MTYDITISKQGTSILTVEGVEGLTALAAIDKLEEQKEFKQTIVQLLDRDRTLLEFEARQLDFSLS